MAKDASSLHKSNISTTPFSIKDILAKSESSYRNECGVLGEESSTFQQTPHSSISSFNDDINVYQSQSFFSNLQRFYAASNALQSLLLFSNLPRLSFDNMNYELGDMVQLNLGFSFDSNQINLSNQNSSINDDCMALKNNQLNGVSTHTNENKSQVSKIKRKKDRNVAASPLHELEKFTCVAFQGMEKQQLKLHTIANGCEQRTKRRKCRTTFTSFQLSVLEKRFQCHHYLTPADRDSLAQTLGLTSLQVITWFQNRRAKLKRDVQELKNDLQTIKTWVEPDIQSNLENKLQNNSKFSQIANC